MSRKAPKPETHEMPQSQDGPKAQDGPEADEEPELYIKELNPQNSQTILLLHGLLSSHLEYTFVTPHLSTYHIILADLPQHSQSSTISPTTIPVSALQISRIIAKYAHGGKAHIIGLSFGGFVALYTAAHYPSLVKSVFATGAAPFVGFRRWFAERPSIIWHLQKTVGFLPDAAYWWIARRRGIERHDDLLVEMKRNLRWETVRDGFESCARDLRDLEDITCRVLCVAGGKEDDVESTRAVCAVIRGDEEVVDLTPRGDGTSATPGNQSERRNSKAVVVRDAIHAWDLQFPELFAQGVRAWIEGEELPAKFELL